jgi:hypothetical protein
MAVTAKATSCVSERLNYALKRRSSMSGLLMNFAVTQTD